MLNSDRIMTSFADGKPVDNSGRHSTLRCKSLGAVRV
jgi:hypothetical protein